MNKKQSLAIASASAFAAGLAHGDIIYSGPIGYEISGTASYPLDLDGDSTIDYNIRFDGYNGSDQHKPFLDARSTNPNAWVLSKTNTGAPVVSFGTAIGDDFAATYPPNKVGYLYEQYDDNTVVGDWPIGTNTDAYVGVEINSGSVTNYGWVHLIYKAADVNNMTLVLVDYAYESDSGKSIIAGATQTPGAPVIYFNPSSQTAGGGSTVQMKVVALADPPPAYQWQAGAVGSGVYTNLPENGHFSGTTSDTLTISGVSLGDGLDYIAVVTNLLGSATSSPPATLTLAQAVLNGPFPAQAQLFAGQTGHFGINVASGVPTGFQWRKDGQDLTDGVKYSGSTSSNLTINSLTTDDAGNFDVIVTTVIGSVTSSVAPLSIVTTNGSAFAASVVANGAVNYYRLNETSNPFDVPPPTVFDNIGGRNGVYGMDVWNGSPSYNITGPTPADGFPGFANTNAAILTFANDANATITLPPWNLNTNTVTITAWINPQGQQAQGAGVVYTRGLNGMVCGLAYHGAPNADGEYSLGYNWNDQLFAWNWTSGLLVPQNQWSFVAVVVTPTNATVYVINTNGINYNVNPATHAVQSFDSTICIGTDPGGADGSRNFNGKIDEVAVFNRSLTMSQLFGMYAGSLGLAALPPQITRQPRAQKIYAGQTAHLQVSVTGSQPLTYRWQSGSGGVYTDLADNGNLTGTASDSLAIHNFSVANVADYIVIVANAGGTVTSSVAHVSFVPTTGSTYESALLAAGAGGSLAAYYTLDETEDPASGGVVAYDFAGGFNGIYGTAMQNGNPNYAIAGPRPADGFTGFSDTNYAARMTISNNQAEIICPPLNLNTNAVTITAWINPASPPQPFTGLVFCRGGAGMVAGLDFTQTNDDGDACLGYHWNDANDTYSWNSGLVPPQNQWSFVALVVDPVTTNATIYLINSNGLRSAVNTTTNNLAFQSFNASLHLGNDPRLTDGSLVFDGSIDNVGIFAAALTPAQIQSLYDAASGHVTLLIQPVADGKLQLQWSTGTLLEATDLRGPWTTNNVPSPYTVQPTEPQKFYRVQVP